MASKHNKSMDSVDELAYAVLTLEELGGSVAGALELLGALRFNQVIFEYSFKR